jgi:hypothetical protein
MHISREAGGRKLRDNLDWQIALVVQIIAN